MDKRTVYDNLNNVEEVLQKTLKEVVSLKRIVQEVIEKNATLEIENQLLHERLSAFELKKDTKAVEKKTTPSKARSMLESLYNDGFHICNNCYGQRRVNNEECLLCIGTMDRK